MGEQRSIDDPRWERGTPVLDRQTLHGGPPRSVPELEPTPLQPFYINLSAIGLVCGAVAITALELGVPLGSALLKVCVIVGAPPLLLTTADASLRIWRSARAWMPVDPGKAWFRVTWLVPAFALLASIVAIGSIVLQA
jgi:hypothetical protein